MLPTQSLTQAFVESDQGHGQFVALVDNRVVSVLGHPAFGRTVHRGRIHQSMTNVHGDYGAVMCFKGFDGLSSFHVPKSYESVGRGRVQLFAIWIGGHGRDGSRVTFQRLKVHKPESRPA